MLTFDLNFDSNGQMTIYIALGLTLGGTSVYMRCKSLTHSVPLWLVEC